MAQTGYTPLYLYYSGTSTHVPLAASLGNGELAINAADGNLFYKNTSNAVVTVPLLQSSGSQNGWLSSTDWTTFNGKQAALVSGTNIKTVNGTSLLGSGDVGTIDVSHGGTGVTTVGTGQILTGNGASAMSASSNLYYTSANTSLHVGGAFFPDNTFASYFSGNSGFLAYHDTVGLVLKARTASVFDFSIYSAAGDAIMYTLAGTKNAAFAGNVGVTGTTTTNGVYFNGGSSTLLNDYETGTWTPTDQSGAGLSLTVNGATYTKIGRIVYICFYVDFPATASSANVTIGGLPYTSQSANTVLSYVTGRCGYSTAGQVIGQIGANSSQITLYGSAGTTSITNANMSSQYLIFSGCYQTP